MGKNAVYLNHGAKERILDHLNSKQLISVEASGSSLERYPEKEEIAVCIRDHKTKVFFLYNDIKRSYCIAGEHLEEVNNFLKKEILMKDEKGK